MKLGKNTPAVISGGASGLGAAVAKRLRTLEVPVTIFDMNAESGPVFAKEIGAEFASRDGADLDLPMAPLPPSTEQWAAADQGAPGCFQVGLQGGHQGVAVDDAGSRRPECAAG